MAKLQTLEQDYQDILDVFQVVISQTALERNVRFKILGDEKQKEIGVVKKASPEMKLLNNVDVIVIVNQLVMEHLDDVAQILVAEEILARVVYDSEKDKITIKKPDYSTFSLIELKYGADVVKNTKEVIKEIYSQQNEK